MMEPKVTLNKSLLLKNDTSVKHVIGIDPDDELAVMYIWVRDISFLDIQTAAQKMFLVEKGDVTFNLSGYWEYAFQNWITQTEPQLSQDEILSLKGYVGEQIAKIMPQPNEIAESLQGGFTNPSS